MIRIIIDVMPFTIKIDPVIPTNPEFISQSSAAVLIAIEEVMGGPIASQLQDEFRKRTEGWNHQPAFPRNFFSTVDQIGIEVIPDGENKKIWKFVSRGTKTHYITGKGASRGRPILYVKGGIGGYTPRTQPGDVYGGPGNYDMSGTFYTSIVHHPGIEARQFEEAIADGIEDTFVELVQRAIDGAVTL